jgi:hypothetical protein
MEHGADLSIETASGQDYFSAGHISETNDDRGVETITETFVPQTEPLTTVETTKGTEQQVSDSRKIRKLFRKFYKRI